MEIKPEKFRRADFNPLKIGCRDYFRRCDETFSKEEGTISQYREAVAKTLALCVYNGTLWGAVSGAAIRNTFTALESLIN